MKPNFLCFTLLFELIKTEVTVPDLPAEVKPPNRLKYYNLELKLKIKNDRESRRKVEAAAKRIFIAGLWTTPDGTFVELICFII